MDYKDDGLAVSFVPHVRGKNKFTPVDVDRDDLAICFKPQIQVQIERARMPASETIEKYIKRAEMGHDYARNWIFTRAMMHPRNLELRIAAYYCQSSLARHCSTKNKEAREKTRAEGAKRKAAQYLKDMKRRAHWNTEKDWKSNRNQSACMETLAIWADCGVTATTNRSEAPSQEKDTPSCSNATSQQDTEVVPENRTTKLNKPDTTTIGETAEMTMLKGALTGSADLMQEVKRQKKRRLSGEDDQVSKQERKKERGRKDQTNKYSDQSKEASAEVYEHKEMSVTKQAREEALEVEVHEAERRRKKSKKAHEKITSAKPNEEATNKRLALGTSIEKEREPEQSECEPQWQQNNVRPSTKTKTKEICPAQHAKKNVKHTEERRQPFQQRPSTKEDEEAHQSFRSRLNEEAALGNEDAKLKLEQLRKESRDRYYKIRADADAGDQDAIAQLGKDRTNRNKSYHKMRYAADHDRGQVGVEARREVARRNDYWHVHWADYHARGRAGDTHAIQVVRDHRFVVIKSDARRKLRRYQLRVAQGNKWDRDGNIPLYANMEPEDLNGKTWRELENLNLVIPEAEWRSKKGFPPESAN